MKIFAFILIFTLLTINNPTLAEQNNGNLFVCNIEVDSLIGEDQVKTATGCIGLIKNITTYPTIELLINVGDIYSSPSWSKDGRKIAYISVQSGNPELWIYDIFGKYEIQLTFNKLNKSRPVWNYQSNKIYYMQKDNIHWQIVSIDIISKEINSIRKNSNNDLSDPEVIPGDSLILYVVGPDQDDSTFASLKENVIILGNLLTHKDDTLIYGGINRCPRISHDGGIIAYEHLSFENNEKTLKVKNILPNGHKLFNIANNGFTAIRLYDLKNHSISQLTNYKNYWGACWSSDDNYIFAMRGYGEGYYSRLRAMGGEIFASSPKIVQLPIYTKDSVKEPVSTHHIWLKSEEIFLNGNTITIDYELMYYWPRVFDCY